MTGMKPTKVPQMRLLAARLRVQAADTSIALYRRKFDGLAADLEEAAQEAESEISLFQRMGWDRDRLRTTKRARV